MVSILRILFAWPNGIVVGNLIASAIWGLPTILHLHLRISRVHRDVKAAKEPPRDFMSLT